MMYMKVMIVRGKGGYRVQRRGGGRERLDPVTLIVPTAFSETPLFFIMGDVACCYISYAKVAIHENSHKYIYIYSGTPRHPVPRSTCTTPTPHCTKQTFTFILIILLLYEYQH